MFPNLDISETYIFNYLSNWIDQDTAEIGR
jgi:hypothetical protein